jgi:Intein splicing domain
VQLASLTAQRSVEDLLPDEPQDFTRQHLGGVSFRSVGAPDAAVSLGAAYAQATALVTTAQDIWRAQFSCADLLWDVVESIAPAGEEEVFDICVPSVHNFVANGIVVHNSTYARCGLIVNVTPLEPEWQGYVTIEISNTTPLPARVYANEGIAQVLFLESDEDCMTSYADKSGKYQNQVGVVPPRM